MPASPIGPDMTTNIDFSRGRTFRSESEPPTLRSIEILADAVKQAAQEKTGRIRRITARTKILALNALIEAARAATVGEFDARSPVAQEKPAHVPDARGGKPFERHIELPLFVRLRDATVRAPGVRPEIDTVVQPGQVGANRERGR